MAQLEITQDAVLMGERYISLTTYRKNGNLISTPVWFAEDEGKIYIVSIKGSGKIKRIRNNAHVKLAPCNARGIVHGATLKGMASLHEPDTAMASKAMSALRQKYGFTIRLFEFVWWIRGNKKIFIEVNPQ